jgi:hypothetical protein
MGRIFHFMVWPPGEKDDGPPGEREIKKLAEASNERKAKYRERRDSLGFDAARSFLGS